MGKKLTQEYLYEMFGDSMPMEAAILLSTWEGNHDDLLEKLKEISEKTTGESK